jgi:SNF2-related domain/Helicase conserved C-terminal domain
MSPSKILTKNSSRALTSAWTPHSWQLEAVRFMVNRPAAGLFIDPGGGKSSITLAAFLVRLNAGRAKKLLIVSKLRIVQFTWGAEITKWRFPFRHCVMHGPKKQELLESDDYDVHLTNFDSLAWLAKQPQRLLRKFDMLVIDESSAIKDGRTLRFRSLKKILPLIKYRHILTGSPMPQSLEDLFSQTFALDLGQTFGPYITMFRNEYMVPAGYKGYEWVPKPDAEKRIFEKLAPVVLRLPPDLIKLPPISIIDRIVELPGSARRKYDALENAFVVEWKSGRVTAANAAVAAGKLRQMAGGAVYTEAHDAIIVHNEKLDEIESLHEELGGEPTLVAYEYQHELIRLQERFPKGEALAGLSKPEAEDLVARFNAGKVPMLFGQPLSVAHGLNLQASAKVVIWMTLSWSVELYEQLIQRIWRQGQKKHVHVYRIITKGTVDETVIKALDTKDRRQQRLLQALEERYGKQEKGKAGKTGTADQDADAGKNRRGSKVGVRQKKSTVAAEIP